MISPPSDPCTLGEDTAVPVHNKAEWAPEIEGRFLGRPARIVVCLPTELSRLRHNQVLLPGCFVRMPV